MKKIIITIIFLSFSIALFAKAYTSYNNVHTSDDTPRLSYYNYDTLQYITRDFNDSQNVYLNKPLKDLLKKVELKPYGFCPIPSKVNDNNIYGIAIDFSKDSIIDNIILNDKHGNYFSLIVQFAQLISESDFMQIARENNFIWNRQVRNTIGKLPIKSFKFIYNQH